MLLVLDGLKRVLRFCPALIEAYAKAACMKGAIFLFVVIVPFDHKPQSDSQWCNLGEEM